MKPKKAIWQKENLFKNNFIVTNLRTGKSFKKFRVNVLVYIILKKFKAFMYKEMRNCNETIVSLQIYEKMKSP